MSLEAKELTFVKWIKISQDGITSASGMLKEDLIALQPAQKRHTVVETRMPSIQVKSPHTLKFSTSPLKSIHQKLKSVFTKTARKHIQFNHHQL